MYLFDLIEKGKWQKMQEGFAKTLGVSVQTVDSKGMPIPGVNIPSSFCLDVYKSSSKTGKAEIEECFLKLINKIKKEKDYSYIVCPFGLYLYGIPVRVKEEGPVAYVMIGPIMMRKRGGVEEYKKIAKNRGISLDYLTDRLAGLKRFSFYSIESAVELVQEVTCYIVQLKYDTKRLRERYDVPEALDELIKELYSSVYFEELLIALLDASLHTSKGNTASIMLLDQDKGELKVRFSHGLKDDVVNKSRVKIGEAISGIVAKNKKPLLIDDSIKDSKIKNRLKRPYIRSSIVYPLQVKDKVFGVLNLNNTEAKARFDSETLGLIGDLTRLTNIALTMFPHKP